MRDKYHMSRQENIFLAKRNIVDLIWKSANLEGFTVTYPETEAIYNGLAAKNMKVDDIVAINNLKYAWRFVLENLDYPFDFQFLCEINKIVGSERFIRRTGDVRNAPVSVAGTAWKPDISLESQVRKQLEEIMANPDITDRALTLGLYGMRAQIYFDGNKRTSMLAANHILIAHGAGILSVPLEKQIEFTALLIKYYETGHMTEAKVFLYENCIEGLDIGKNNRDKDFPRSSNSEEELLG